MPRTPAEATRFTATRPHVHSQSSFASTIDLAGPPPPNETPAQKVMRLREAARRAKLSQESRWDRVIARGKVVADTAHKTVTGGLILTSLVAAGFAALSFTSMALENRRKKKEWFAEQQSNYDKAVALAKRAEADGTITPSLKLFLNKERALQQAEAEKKAQPGFFSRIKKTAFGGLAFEEAKAAGDTAAQQTEATGGQTGKTSEFVPEVAVGSNGPMVKQAAHDSRLVESRGGPLDRLGEQAAASLSSSSQSWFNWVARR